MMHPTATTSTASKVESISDYQHEEHEHEDEHTSEIDMDAFLATKASTTLRICCYGSSSSKTPQKYLDEAFNLDKVLAKRGHICVNGAGAYGCMVSCLYGSTYFGALHIWCAQFAQVFLHTL